MMILGLCAAVCRERVNVALKFDANGCGPEKQDDDKEDDEDGEDVQDYFQTDIPYQISFLFIINVIHREGRCFAKCTCLSIVVGGGSHGLNDVVK